MRKVLSKHCCARSAQRGLQQLLPQLLQLQNLLLQQLLQPLLPQPLRQVGLPGADFACAAFLRKVCARPQRKQFVRYNIGGGWRLFMSGAEGEARFINAGPFIPASCLVILR